MTGIEMAQEIKTNYDENLSILYPLLEQRIAQIDYREEESAFWGEFLCFEYDYAMYRIHMEENGIAPKVVFDIGCQFGFQSVLFSDTMKYAGIDICENKFFDKENPSISYIVGAFPKGIARSFVGEAVISNMSMGYFNGWAGINDQDIVDALSGCKTLYIAATPEIIEALKPKYRNFYEFEHGKREIAGQRFPRVAMWN